MRHGGGRLARQAYYDRAPIDRLLSYAAVVAPHADTVRATRTVPSGSKAFLELCQLKLIIVTAATTAGNKEANAAFTPSGGTTTNLAQAYLTSDENTVANRDQVVFGTSMLLLPGDVLDLRTADAGTGGTVRYFAFGKLTEFDA